MGSRPRPQHEARPGHGSTLPKGCLRSDHRAHVHSQRCLKLQFPVQGPGRRQVAVPAPRSLRFLLSTRGKRTSSSST